MRPLLADLRKLQNIIKPLTSSYAYAKLYIVQTKAQTKTTIKRRAKMAFTKINTKNVKKNTATLGRKLYAIWFVGIAIVSAVMIYSTAVTTAELFIAASLLVFGLVKLTDSLK